MPQHLITEEEMFCFYLEKHKMFGIYISFYPSKAGELLEKKGEPIYFDKIREAFPFLDSFEIYHNVFFDRRGYIKFNSKEEMEKAFNSIKSTSFISAFAISYGPAPISIIRLDPEIYYEGRVISLDEKN